MSIAQVSVRTGDRITSSLATCFGFDPHEIFPWELDLMREFAFSATSADEFGWFYQSASLFAKFCPDDPAIASVRRDRAFQKFLAPVS